MRKGIFSLLFCTFVFLSLPVLAQQSTLLEKYRTMALDYNHDLKAAEKNIAASMEVEKSARADLKPKLSGAASFQYTGNPMELTLDIPSIGCRKQWKERILTMEVLCLFYNRFIREGVYWSPSVWRNISRPWPVIRRKH